MSKTFGQIIKIQRLMQGLTQGEVCQEVKKILLRQGVDDTLLTQPTLSAWEVDRQAPSAESEITLRALEKVLKLKPSTVQTVLKNSGKRVKLAPDDEYADDVQKWAASARSKPGEIAKHPRIWFLAPNTLPAFFDESDRLFKLWENNILQGVRYRLLWILEEISDDEPFVKLGNYLSKLCEVVEKRGGKAIDAAADLEGPDEAGGPAPGKAKPGLVEVYLIRRPPSVNRQNAMDPLALSSNQRKFKEMQSHWHNRGCSWIKWHDLGNFAQDEEGLRIYDLIEGSHSHLHGRIAIYLGAQRPEAGLLLTNTSSRLEGEPSRIYRWFSDGDARHLARVAENIEQWIADNAEKTSR